uniref:Anoctamin n=1 Tax=Ascaris lumbricoides TaxID=6252 RepID=A0A0M3HT47_ASCLU
MIEEVSSKSNGIGAVAEFATLWQMIAVLVVVTTVACFFFLWTAMLVRANLVAWPLATRERRLKMVRDNEYELIHRYKRELLLNHLFQAPEDEGADDEQTTQNAQRT